MHPSAVLDGTFAPVVLPSRTTGEGRAFDPAGRTPCPLCDLRSPERPPLRFAVSCLEHWLDLNA